MEAATLRGGGCNPTCSACHASQRTPVCHGSVRQTWVGVDLVVGVGEGLGLGLGLGLGVGLGLGLGL